MKNPTFETGASTHAVNDLILFAENDYETVQAIYKQFAIDCIYYETIDRGSIWLPILKKVKENYIKVCGRENSRHIWKLDKDQEADFFDWCKGFFQEWKEENGRKEIESIKVKAKEWFDKVNGNSYCSARVFINGVLVFKIPFQYGYGDFYTQAARDYLKAAGFIDQNTHTLWRAAEQLKFSLNTEIERKCLKKDVKLFGEW